MRWLEEEEVTLEYMQYMLLENFNWAITYDDIYRKMNFFDIEEMYLMMLKSIEYKKKKAKIQQQRQEQIQDRNRRLWK